MQDVDRNNLKRKNKTGGVRWKGTGNGLGVKRLNSKLQQITHETQTFLNSNTIHTYQEEVDKANSLPREMFYD